MVQSQLATSRERQKSPVSRTTPRVKPTVTAGHAVARRLLVAGCTRRSQAGKGTTSASRTCRPQILLGGPVVEAGELCISYLTCSRCASRRGPSSSRSSFHVIHSECLADNTIWLSNTRVRPNGTNPIGKPIGRRRTRRRGREEVCAGGAESTEASV